MRPLFFIGPRSPSLRAQGNANLVRTGDKRVLFSDDGSAFLMYRLHRVVLSGDHHFDEDYDKLEAVITDSIESRRQKSAAKNSLRLCQARDPAL